MVVLEMMVVLEVMLKEKIELGRFHLLCFQEFVSFLTEIFRCQVCNLTYHLSISDSDAHYDHDP